MATVPCTLEDLETELLGLVQELDVFKEKAFSIFGLEDLERLSAEQAGRLPIVGVGYDGAVPKGNQGNPGGEGISGAAFVDIQFLIVIAVNYVSNGQSDNKQSAMSLLHEIRKKCIGYRNVNTRSWRFIGERPEAGASMDGLIFYSQVWQTSVPFVGSQNNP